MSKQFLDTNILLYAHDPRDARKRRCATERVARAIDEGTGVLSTQVLQEYAVNALAKFHLASPVVLRQLAILECLEIVTIDAPLIRRAVELSALYATPYWDASIIAAAEVARCATIVSEDFNSGQYYAGIRIEDPFAARP